MSFSPSSFSEKSIQEKIRQNSTALKSLEVKTNAVENATVAANKHFQFQSTHFIRTEADGDARITTTGASATIDELTNANVIAYGTMNDIGGNGAPITSPFDSTQFSVPMLQDAGGKTAHYHVTGATDPTHLSGWYGLHPTGFNHLRTFMVSRSYRIADEDAFIYYATNTAFNISGTLSMAIWFWPFSTSNPSGTFRTLIWRYQDASNYYFVGYKPSDQKMYCFVNDAATLVKTASTATYTVAGWNLALFRFNGSTNALTPALNNNTGTTTPSDTLTPPITSSAGTLFLGGFLNGNANRHSGYLDMFTAWNIILSSGQATNLFNNGTIT